MERGLAFNTVPSLINTGHEMSGCFPPAHEIQVSARGGRREKMPTETKHGANRAGKKGIVLCSPAPNYMKHKGLNRINPFPRSSVDLFGSSNAVVISIVCFVSVFPSVP